MIESYDMDILKILKSTEYLETFSEDSLEKISRISKIEFYKKNSVIFTEIENGEFIYIVKSGKVKILKISPSGKDFIIKIMKEGDVFAESLLFENGNYPATAETIEDTFLISIKKRELEKLIRLDNDVAVNFVKVMSRRLTFLSKKMENLTVGNSVSKVILLILNLSSNSKGIKADEKFTLIQNVRRQDLANMINISRENFERILSYLAKLNLIGVERNRIIVRDVEGLKRLMYRS